MSDDYHHVNGVHLFCVDDEYVVKGTTGQTVILSCHGLQLQANVSNGLYVMEWKKGRNDSQPLSKLMTSGSEIVFNKTFVAGLWIDATGNLNIHNAKSRDAGLYTCHPTGTTEKIVKLVMKGMYLV